MPKRTYQAALNNPVALFDLIYQLAKSNDIAGLKALQAMGASLGMYLKNETPVERLAREGDHRAVALLLEFGVDIDKAAYGYACGKHVDEAYALQEKGARKEIVEEGFARAGLDEKVGDYDFDDQRWFRRRGHILRGYAYAGLHEDIINRQLDFCIRGQDNFGYRYFCKFVVEGYAYANNQAQIIQLLDKHSDPFVELDIVRHAVQAFGQMWNSEGAKVLRGYFDYRMLNYGNYDYYYESSQDEYQHHFMTGAAFGGNIQEAQALFNEIYTRRHATGMKIGETLQRNLIKGYFKSCAMGGHQITNASFVTLPKLIGLKRSYSFYYDSQSPLLAALSGYFANWHIAAWEALILKYTADIAVISNIAAMQQEVKLNDSIDWIIYPMRDMVLFYNTGYDRAAIFLRALTFIQNAFLRHTFFKVINHYGSRLIPKSLLERASEMNRLMHAHDLNYSQACALTDPAKSANLTKLFLGRAPNAGTQANLPADVTGMVASYVSGLSQNDATDLYKKEAKASKKPSLRSTNLHSFFLARKEAIEEHLAVAGKRKKSGSGGRKRRRCR